MTRPVSSQTTASASATWAAKDRLMRKFQLLLSSPELS